MSADGARRATPASMLRLCPVCGARPGRRCQLVRRGALVRGAYLDYVHSPRVLTGAKTAASPYTVTCPSCAAPPGQECTRVNGARPVQVHETRRKAARDSAPASAAR